MSSIKVLLGALAGLVIGAAAGALTGALFAPSKDKRTRKIRLKKGEAKVEVLKEKFDQSLDSITERFKEEVSDLIEKEAS
ncbi:YtxH domain-containing protein [Sunxiuqinia sp. sy24]|uniref:YtxH domain-containing protein n=1 Tax=Sunxiuqinia sp. sy24 TaxID=3461495 RepID=UPI00404681FB